MHWKILSSSTSEGVQADTVHGDLLGAVRRFYDCAQEWHRREHPEPHRAGVPAAVALDLHAMNFDLWHHEDAVRRAGAPDPEVSCRKRCIDQINERRSAAVESIDLNLLNGAPTNEAARLHTETPGTIVDRLSVLTLRILHTRRVWHHDPRVGVLEEQYTDLCAGLEEYLAAMRSGALRFKVYRQYKAAAQRSYCDLFEPAATDELPVNRRRGWCRLDVCQFASG
jgi:hypothetical protein